MDIPIDHTVETKTVLFKISGNIVISEVKPFINVSGNQVNELKHIVDKHIQGDFGFISKRIDESEISINPAVWENVFKQLPNIKGFALLTNQPSAVESFHIFEKPFITEFGPEGFPAEAFLSFDKAHNWLKEHCFQN